MKYNNITLIVPIGLPGSGKSYYANTLSKTVNPKRYRHQDIKIIDCDWYMEHPKNQYIKMSIKDILDDVFKFDELYYYNTIIMDGPWFTLNDVKKVITQTIDFISNHKPRYKERNFPNDYKVDEIKLVHFEENREACLSNDHGRREESSEITIRNAEYLSEITPKIINDLHNEFGVNITVEEKQVYKANVWERSVVKSIGLQDEQVLKSESWSGGGTWGNCWGNSGNISAESPLEFEEFDKFLEDVCPNITFLEYKNIKNVCCKMEEETECDYYGGSETRYHWECDLDKLKEELIKRGLLEE